MPVSHPIVEFPVFRLGNSTTPSPVVDHIFVRHFGRYRVLTIGVPWSGGILDPEKVRFWVVGKRSLEGQSPSRSSTTRTRVFRSGEETSLTIDSGSIGKGVIGNNLKRRSVYR